jgi:hypothetical protein
MEVEDGYLIVGVSIHFDNPADARGILLKIDFDGVEQWRQEYNYGSLDDELFAIYPTSDDGYILSGWAQASTYDYWLVKTDGNGNEQWNQTYGGNNQDFGHSRLCYQTSDDGYLMTGYSYSFGAGQCDVWTIKTDASGNLEWNFTYGDTYRDVSWSIEEIPENKYVVCVTMNLLGMTGDKADIHLVKIDEDGNIEWVTEYGGEETQIANHIQQTSDEGFITAGRNGQYLATTTDALLVKFQPFPEIAIEITGGFGAEATITNSGDGDAIEVPYEVTVTGGLLGMINHTINGTIDILSGTTETLKITPILGLGPIQVTAKVGYVEETIEGFHLLLFSLL